MGQTGLPTNGKIFRGKRPQILREADRGARPSGFVSFALNEVVLERLSLFRSGLYRRKEGGSSRIRSNL